jgi:hypothetical protein
VRRARRALALVAAALALSGCAGHYFHDAGPAPEAPQLALATWPYRDYWTAIVFNGNKIGYAHVEVRPADSADGTYEIRAESALRLRFLGFDKRVTLRSRDRVRGDLTLAAFDYDYDIDGARLEVTGHVAADTLHVRFTNAGRTETQVLRPEGPLYPASAISMVPALHGLKVGAEYRFTVYSGEAQRLAPVVQRVEGYERSTLFDGPAWKVATEMLGLRTTTWLDERARPMLEIGLGGVLIAGLEDETRAKRELASGALDRNEALLDIALVRLPAPLGDPRSLGYLRLEISGPAVHPSLPEDAAQRCRVADAQIDCELRAAPLPSAPTQPSSAEPEPSSLQSTLTVPSRDPRITALAAQIAAERSLPLDQSRAIVEWMRANIRREPADAFSALDVLAARRGECQGHAYLYAALARALGIPTRVANGLVYSPELQGFAFHAWNESFIGGEWIGVDATLGQVGTDPTHLKIVYGESPGDLAPLASWVGRTRIRVLEAR